ncbi:MAG TPA: flotillin-like protein FloA [Gemmataceae bacterium]|nr:flotillin-like protein FloA [Gemmataceae bacterium]
MSLILFAADDVNWPVIGWVAGTIAAVVILLIFLFIFFSFVGLWVRSILAGADVGVGDMIRMRLLKLDYNQVVQMKIALVQAGVKVSTRELQEYLLANGKKLEQVVQAVIAAHKAGMELPWSTAAAIQLAGRDIYKAVQVSVNPEVIDCPSPNPNKPNNTLDGVCKNGIQLKARARVTVRTKLDRLVGGATQETIIARVGEGIVKAIGSAEHHTDVLANPNLISQAVLHNALDSQTAFEIVSIDVAEIDVGANIGANLQADQAAADLRVAQANAEKRRALAVALEQEMSARVQENRAQVVLAEAQVPLAIADAFKNGRLGVMDYYNLRNIQADTKMRSSIAGVGGDQSSS